MVNETKKLHRITISELEHLMSVNADEIDTDYIDDEDNQERIQLDREFGMVLTEPVAGELAKYSDVMNDLEEDMDRIYPETCKERTAIRNDLIAAGHIKVKKMAPAVAQPVRQVTSTFTFNDGGRGEAGFRGKAGDCVCRAVVIASQRPYREVYDVLANGNASQRKSKRTKNTKRSARNGIYVQRKWFKDYMKSLGFEWFPLMGIGTGFTHHLNADEMPAGRLVVSVKKHYTTMIDGVVHDTWDCSYGGKKGVYGYWKLKA